MAIPAGLLPSMIRRPLTGSGYFTGKRQGYLLAIISAMLLGFTGIIIRILTVHYHLPTSVLAFWRAALVAAVLLPILLVTKPQWAKLRRDQVKFYLAYGLLLAVFNGLWTESVALNGRPYPLFYLIAQWVLRFFWDGFFITNIWAGGSYWLLLSVYSVVFWSVMA